VNDLVCCVDFGSTFTKAALVDVNAGSLLAEADHPTTLDTDVLDRHASLACRVRTPRRRRREYWLAHRRAVGCASEWSETRSW
jgi:ribulose kinase